MRWEVLRLLRLQPGTQVTVNARLRRERRQQVVDVHEPGAHLQAHLVTAEPGQSPGGRLSAASLERRRAKDAARGELIYQRADFAGHAQCATAPTPGSTGSEMPGG